MILFLCFKFNNTYTLAFHLMRLGIDIDIALLFEIVKLTLTLTDSDIEFI